MSTIDAVLSNIDADLPWERALYEDLHEHPELSLQESRTARIVEDNLASFGYRVQRIGGTGVVGVLENGSGPTVLARADVDALPIRKATGVSYASTATATDHDGRTVPVAHACGHDMHVAMLLGAAKKLANGQQSWAGTYIALFQPGEEIGAGAKKMLDDGLVDKIPRPEVAFAQHVMPGPAGRIGTAAGPILSAADSIRVVLYGKGAHGSMPHLSVDPVVLASSVTLRLQTIVSREIEPGEFAVLTVGALHAGTKANIISDEATLLLNLRSYDATVRNRLIASIERIVRAECQASGSPKPPKIDYYDHYPLTSNSALFSIHGVSTQSERSRFVTRPLVLHSARRRCLFPDATRVPRRHGISVVGLQRDGTNRKSSGAILRRETALERCKPASYLCLPFLVFDGFKSRLPLKFVKPDAHFRVGLFRFRRVLMKILLRMNS